MASLALVLFASALLFFPLWFFRASTAKLGSFDQRAWPTGRNLWLTVLDAVRGSVGAGLLAKGFVSLAEDGRWAGWRPELAIALVLAVAFAVQTFVWRSEDYVHAPLAFLVGVVSAMVHPLVMALVLPLMIGAPLALRAWAACFIGSGLSLVGVGLLVEVQDWRRTLLLGVIVPLPVLFSVMSGRHMGLPRK